MFSIRGLGFCLILISATMASSKIEAPLLQILTAGQTARVSVSMTDDASEVTQRIENLGITDRGERANAVHREFTAFATESQKNVVKLLEKEKDRISFTWESLWINNQIIVNGADLQLVNDIAAIDNVAKIEGEKFVQLQ